MVVDETIVFVRTAWSIGKCLADKEVAAGRRTAGSKQATGGKRTAGGHRRRRRTYMTPDGHDAGHQTGHDARPTRRRSPRQSRRLHPVTTPTADQTSHDAGSPRRQPVTTPKAATTPVNHDAGHRQNQPRRRKNRQAKFVGRPSAQAKRKGESAELPPQVSIGGENRLRLLSI